MWLGISGGRPCALSRGGNLFKEEEKCEQLYAAIPHTTP